MSILPDPPRSAQRFYMLSSIAIIVAGLYLARDLLIPIAFSIFLSFLLAPLATRLERIGLGKIPGSLMSVALAFAVMVGFGVLITDQIISLADQLPKYEDNVRAKIRSLQEASAGFMSRGAQSIHGFTEPLSETAPATLPVATPLERLSDPESVRRLHGQHLFHPPGSDAQSEQAPLTSIPANDAAPVPVRIVEKAPGPLTYLSTYGTALLGPLGTAGLVTVLAIFILIQRRDVRDRLITLTGRGQIFVTTQAFDDMTRRISRYLLMQLVVNTCYAVPVAVGLALFGIPNALLWGLMGLVLRFIPYIGAWFTAGVSVVLAIAVFPGWWGPAGVLAFFVVLELFLNNVIEPWLYSVGTGVSVLGVILSAVFWAWVWGPIGLILATPIAVCLTVIGKYIPQLQFLDTLFGGEATLEPKLRFVQRLLAMDLAEAMEIAEDYRKSEGLLALYDGLIVPALQMAEQERHRGLIEERKESFLNRAFREVIDECAEKEKDEHAKAAAKAESSGSSKPESLVDGAPAAVPVSMAQNIRVMCLPAGDEADELSGIMLQHLLEAQGYQVETASVESLSSELLAEVEEKQAHIVFISALPPGALVAARYLCKRVSARWAKIPVLVGLWNAAGNVGYARERLESCGNSKVVTSYAAALAETMRATQALQFAS